MRLSAQFPERVPRLGQAREARGPSAAARISFKLLFQREYFAPL